MRSARTSATSATPCPPESWDPVSTMISATPIGIIYGFTADGFTQRELRDYVEKVRSRLLQVQDVSKIDVLGAQDERIFIEFSTRQLAGLGIDRSQLIAALQQQNAVSPSGRRADGRREAVAARLRRLRLREAIILAINILANGRLVRLRDIAEIRRASVDPPQPMFRVNGPSGDRLGDRHAARRRRSGAGRNIANAMKEATAGSADRALSPSSSPISRRSSSTPSATS